VKVLVTGATSGLGRNAVGYLNGLGLEVRTTGRDHRRGARLRSAGHEFIPADLATLDDVAADSLLRDVDAVWHCAALSSPWGAYRDFFAANVDATERLATAAATRGIGRFVHVSTPSIYFDFKHHRDIVEDYRARRFANHYAATKWLAEEHIRRLAARRPRTCFAILRPRGLFGPHDRVLLPRILALLKSHHGVLPLPRGGEAMVDLTFVGNACQAMMAATTAKFPSGAAFNITNHQPQSLRSVLTDLLRERLGLDLRIRALPYPLLHAAAQGLETWGKFSGREPPFTRYSVAALNFDMTLDNTRARQQLGYKPSIDMRDGIELTARWFREHGKTYRI
jgi:nucleoside-diphosphate-sugar epimerase